MLLEGSGPAVAARTSPPVARPEAHQPDAARFERAVAQTESGRCERAVAPEPADAETVGPSGPNGFGYTLQGPDPNLAVGGSYDERERQRDATLRLVWPSVKSYATGQLPDAARSPTDDEVRARLAGLERNPPVGRDGDQVTHAVYRSHIPNASAEEVYRHFVDHPEEVFAAGGMEIRPPAGSLQDGGRYMLETGGPPPVWLPVEIRLNPAERSVTIHTLDGHPLRGEQTFTFRDDCAGGTTLTQDARFQAGSDLVGEAQRVASLSDGQHTAWEHAHREIYEQFNGGAGYTGIGTSALSPEMAKGWLELAARVAADPSNAIDAGIGATGVLANATYDQAGRIADRGLDRAGLGVNILLDRYGLPGGDRAERALDGVGNGVEAYTDKHGDVVQFVADKGGDLVTGRIADLFS